VLILNIQLLLHFAQHTSLIEDTVFHKQALLSKLFSPRHHLQQTSSSLQFCAQFSKFFHRLLVCSSCFAHWLGLTSSKANIWIAIISQCFIHVKSRDEGSAFAYYTALLPLFVNMFCLLFESGIRFNAEFGFEFTIRWNICYILKGFPKAKRKR